MKYRLETETPLGIMTLIAGENAVEELLLPGDIPARSIPERRTV